MNKSVPPDVASGSQVERKQQAAKGVNRTRPLLQWALFAGVLGAVVVVIGGELLVDAVRTDSSGIATIIACFGLIAFAKNFSDAFYLDTQSRRAYGQLQDLIATGSISQFLDTAIPSVFTEHVRNLNEIARRDLEIGQDSLISLLHVRMHARFRLTDLIANLLITLGLIGTIVGLIGSVKGIDAVLANVGDDKKALFDGLRDTVSGMGTAFYTTLLGSILGGVTLRGLAHLTLAHSDSLIAQIAEISEVYLLPTLRSAARRKHGAALATTAPPQHDAEDFL